MNKQENTALLGGLRYLRLLKLMTQKELGAQIGRTGNYVSQLEKGYRSPGLTTLRMLRDALDCSIPELRTKPTEKQIAELPAPWLYEDPTAEASEVKQDG